MKRLIFGCAAGVAALAMILVLLFPSLVVDLVDLMPASLPTPPKGFDLRREGIGRGKVETVEYCQDTLKLLDKYKIQYVYVQGKGLHNWETARNDLFVFAPLPFREAN